MAQTLDFSVPPFQMLVGSFDVTNAVESFWVDHPLCEPYSPLVWGGEINLTYLLDMAQFAESFDDQLNPARWAAGQYPIYLYLNGNLFQTLRIDRLGYVYNEIGSTALATIRLTDILGLLDTYCPPQDLPGITIGSGTPWNIAVDRLIKAAARQVGVSVTTSINSYGIGDRFTTPRQVSSGSFIKEAQKICGERGIWLWCDNEIITTAQYPLYGGSVVYQKSRAKVDQYARVTGLEPPVNKMTVVCPVQAVSPCQKKYPIVTDIPVTLPDGTTYIRQRTTENKTVVGNVQTQRIQLEVAYKEAFPPTYTISGDPYVLITVLIRTIVTTFDQKEGKILKVEETIDKALGLYEDVRGSVSAYYWQTLLYGCEKSVTTYTLNPSGALPTIGNNLTIPQIPPPKQLKSIQVDTYAPKFTLAAQNPLYSPLDFENYRPVLAKTVLTTWKKTCGDNYDEVVTTFTTAVSNTQDENQPSWTSETTTPNTQPPEQPTLEPLYPLSTVLLKGDANFAYANFSHYTPNTAIEQAETLVNEAGCRRYARLKGLLRWQRYYSRSITHPYESSVLAYEPFQAVNVHIGSWVRDGFRISAGSEGSGDTAVPRFEVSYKGNLIGNITAVTDIPPVTPSVPVPVIIDVVDAGSTLVSSGAPTFSNANITATAGSTLVSSGVPTFA